MMLVFIRNIPQDLHPILIHFPIAFLGFSFVLSFLSMRVSRWNEASWLLLWVGGLSCIPASVSGVISHFPYEETELHGVIETHQNFGILGDPFCLRSGGNSFVDPAQKQGFWFAVILSDSGWGRTHLDHPAGWNRRAIDLSIWDLCKVRQFFVP